MQRDPLLIGPGWGLAQTRINHLGASTNKYLTTEQSIAQHSSRNRSRLGVMPRIWLRRWGRSLLLTAQFSATIAIGMGAAAALVSLLLALGYQPLPYRDPGRLV